MKHKLYREFSESLSDAICPEGKLSDYLLKNNIRNIIKNDVIIGQSEGLEVKIWMGDIGLFSFLDDRVKSRMKAEIKAPNGNKRYESKAKEILSLLVGYQPFVTKED